MEKNNAVRLWRVEFYSKGVEYIRKLSITLKVVPEAGQIVSRGQTLAEIYVEMESIVKDFYGLLVDLGQGTGVEPIHIDVDNSIRLFQLKRRPVPLKYVERFEFQLDNSEAKEVVSG